jgi:hypothetical protein
MMLDRRFVPVIALATVTGVAVPFNGTGLDAGNNN